MGGITIGKLANQAGVNIETVRYYERRGLLPDPRSSNGGGYRVYADEDVARLMFIKRARKLGFTLKEVEELLALRSRPDNFCHRLADLARHRLEQLERRIAEMQTARNELRALSAACGDCSDDACPMLDGLELAPIVAES